MDGKDMPRAVARECDLTRPTRLRHEDAHAGHHPLERTLHRPNADIELRILVEHDMVFKEDRHAAIQPRMQHRHELTLDAVANTGRRTVFELSGKDLRRCVHSIPFVWWLGAEHLDARTPCRHTE